MSPTAGCGHCQPPRNDEPLGFSTHAKTDPVTVKFRIVVRLMQALGVGCVVLLAVLVGATALGEAFGLVEVPLALQFGPATRAPLTFTLHMGFGGLALLLAPLTASLHGFPGIHRPLGRVTSMVVLVAGLAALPVALVSTATPVARLGFLVQGLVWLALLGIGLGAIRRGHRERHRSAMLLMTCVAFGAVVLRLLLALQMQLFPFDDFHAAYAGMAWVSWMLPLCAGALYLRTRPPCSPPA